MRVCPQCQYENPDDHRFCQRCGASLGDASEADGIETVEKNAGVGSEQPDLGQSAALSLPESDADAPSEQLWHVIYSLNYPSSIAVGTVQSGQDDALPASEMAPLFNGNDYLDQNHRYQVLDHPPLISGTELEFRVRDRHPDLPPYLVQFYGVEMDGDIDGDDIDGDIYAMDAMALEMESEDGDDADWSTADWSTTELPAEAMSDPKSSEDEAEVEFSGSVNFLESGSLDSSGFAKQIKPSRDLTLPTVVQIYLNLQDQLPPSLPRLHDAWQQEGNVVVLLEDRSHLTSILTCLQDDAILPFQVISWFYYTTKLWDVLQEHGCCQSLLDITNLRVDEDYILCLQRLQVDSVEHPPTLQNLGHLWQQLFQQAQRTYLGAIAQLCYQLESGVITTIPQLQEQLRIIADEFQPEPPLPEVEAFLPKDLSLTPDSPPSPVMNDPNFEADLTTAESADLLSLDEDNSGQPTTRPVSAELMETETDAEGDDLPTVVLPMQLLSIEDAGQTDIGRQRKDNQDYFTIKTNICKTETPTGRAVQAQGLYILCDGMGGHAGGEIASAMATQTLEQYFSSHWTDHLPDEATIVEGIRLANNAIYDLNIQSMRSGSGRMGTTLVLVMLRETDVAIAHVGDSRLYRYSRRQGLELLTVDHEVGQREIQRGVDPEVAYSHPEAYQLTQALGPRDQDFVHPDVTFLEVNEDTIFLLCSDGLTDNDLVEIHCSTYIEPLLSPQANLEHGVSQLIDLANHYNGHDNISAILVRVRVRPSPSPFGRSPR
jgi:protein phosphatase